MRRSSLDGILGEYLLIITPHLAQTKALGTERLPQLLLEKLLMS